MESAIDDPLDGLLRRSWHAVATVDEVGTGPLSVTLLDRPLVLVRLDETISAFDD